MDCMNDINILNLASQVIAARKAYYCGVPIMSDDAYDALEADLKRVAPDHAVFRTVGALVENSLDKTTHRVFMGSLENAFESDDITTWVAKINKLTGGKVNWCVVQPKMDGLSVNLQYTDGVFEKATTRGDGKIGEDVTASILKIKSLPRHLPLAISCDIRCEAMLTKDAFEKYFKSEGYANPRNAAAGTLRRKDALKAEHLIPYAFDVQFHGDVPADIKSRLLFEDASIQLLEEWRFTVVPCRKVEFDGIGLVRIWEEALAARSSLPYEVDGIVVKVNHRRLQEKCGWSDTCPVGCRALKWRGQMIAETEVVGIVNSVGHTGTITPVAKVKPVSCGGVVIENVSLMNWDEIDRIAAGSVLNTGVMKGTIGVGSVVRVERAGDVIPRIIAVIKSCPAGSEFQRPAACPCCGALTVVDGPRQMCPSSACSAQVFGKIMRWVKGRNILHLGESTVEALMKSSGGPVETVADLYKLSVADLTKACGGLAMARKVFKSIEKSKECTLTQLFGNLGIASIGETEADKVVMALKAVKADDVLVQTRKKFCEILGDIRGAAFCNGITQLNEIIEQLACGNEPLLLISRPVQLDPSKVTAEWSGKTFCITGATELPRATLIKILTEAGGVSKGSVVNGLNYLIMADPDSNSNKAVDARKKGVTCISEIQALKWAGKS